MKKQLTTIKQIVILTSSRTAEELLVLLSSGYYKASKELSSCRKKGEAELKMDYLMINEDELII